MTAIDLGCGSGSFTLTMAECVGPGGLVFGVDDSAEMLERLRSKGPPPWIKLVEADAARTGLDGRRADACLLSCLLHEVSQPGALLDEAYRLLKPGGRVVVMEWKLGFDSPGPPQRIRLSRDRLEKLFLESAFTGFEYLDWSDHYALAAARRAGPAVHTVRKEMK
jgi:ubiquinone/menaquinone biosynthesis C-methylase UbiE